MNLIVLPEAFHRNVKEDNMCRIETGELLKIFSFGSHQNNILCQFLTLSLLQVQLRSDDSSLRYSRHCEESDSETICPNQGDVCTSEQPLSEK